MLVGAVVLARLEDGSYPEAEFTAMMDAALSRPEDRKLFGLPVAVPDETRPANDSTDSGAVADGG